jgi:hypothetical protein
MNKNLILSMLESDLTDEETDAKGRPISKNNDKRKKSLTKDLTKKPVTIKTGIPKVKTGTIWISKNADLSFTSPHMV